MHPNNSKHAATTQKEKSAPIMHQSAKGKSHVDYWEARLVRRKSGEWHSPDLSVQVSHGGKRVWFNTRTPNKKAAAARAKEFYQAVVGSGWETANEKFKPEAQTRGKRTEKPLELPQATVGTLIATVGKLSTARPASLHAYTKALRKIAGDVFPPKKGRKFPAGKQGREAWREAIDAIPLSDLLPAKVLAWKKAFLSAAGNDPVAVRAAAITCNSVLRNAKALFSKKLLSFVRQEIAITDPLPFENVPFEKAQSMRYKSVVDAGKVLRAARAELVESDPEAFKALLLLLACGLRRSEADTLQWSAFDFTAGKLAIAQTIHNPLKSEDSAGEIGLDPETVRIFRGFKANATGEFVLESPNAPRPYNAHRHYRANAIFERLIAWLVAQGVPSGKPLHTMRKEFGSLLVAKFGLYAASRALRHSTPAITAAHYADQKNPATFALSDLLPPEKTNITPMPGQVKRAPVAAKGKAGKA